MSSSSPCDPESSVTSDPCALVLFGATGDLTHRKLVPALYSLFTQDLLPARFAIVAFARRPKDDTEYRQDLHAAVREFAPGLPADSGIWNRFADQIFYHRANLDDLAGYAGLKRRIAELDSQLGLSGNRLFYLATPPDNFVEITRNLRTAGLSGSEDTDNAWTRILIEKPFGIDLESARELNREVRAGFAESQIYRIDHFLGKETVQNILVLRFANRLFELLWNHLYIDNVQITVAETLGMEGRGAYFDETGITRDMIQNHALQILSLVAMEPPVSLEADSIRDEKVKVLRSIRAFSLEDARDHTVRGQYSDGTLMGERVESYRDESGVPRDSQTETFAAMRIHVDNWRWAGVPFFVRAGKRLADRETKVVIQLRDVPDVLFNRLSCAEVTPNRITVRIQPDEGVDILMSAKEPGPSVVVSPVVMHFDYSEAFGKTIPDAYERLLLNAILGDASLFARDDEVETAWEIITPILEAWQLSHEEPRLHAAGTWGPREADDLLASTNHTWWN